MTHLENILNLRNRLASKVAFAPQPPMDPAMMGGQPPMDPAMMGGQPPMDPAMMGGQPPMDPTMMGAPMPPAPMDPAMMGGAPGGQPPMDMASMAALAQQLGIGSGAPGGAPAAPASSDELNQKIDAIGFMLMKVVETMGIDISGEGGEGGGQAQQGMAPPQGPPMGDPAQEEVGEDGSGGPQSLDNVDEDVNNKVLSESVKEGGGEDSYIARQLRKLRR